MKITKITLYMSIEDTELVLHELKNRNLSIRQFARLSGLTLALFHSILTGQRSISDNFKNALLTYLNINLQITEELPLPYQAVGLYLKKIN